MMEEHALVEEFVNLVRIPSPSGHEREVAMYIMAKLRSMGLEPVMDDANFGTKCDSGNVMVRIPGEGPTIMFLAHMDTVEDGRAAVNPVIDGESIRSDGKTILGADNKGGVASLLGAIEEAMAMEKRPNVICAFTICEETTFLGARKVEMDGNIDFVFDIDGGGAPGAFVNRALGAEGFNVKFFGVESHAARAPEKGKHAVRAAGLLVSGLRMGKDDADGSTLNVGAISGGGATNIVPAYAEVIGEMRAYSAGGLEKRMRQVEDAAKEACRLTGCTYKLTLPEEGHVSPFETPLDQGIVRLAEASASAAGLAFRPFTLDACVQANALAQRTKLPMLGLCRGGEGAHSRSEWTTKGNLVAAKNLLVAIIRNANGFAGRESATDAINK